MQAAQRPLLGPAVIVLHETQVQSSLGESALVPRLEKESSLVAVDPGLDQDDVRNPCRPELHVTPSPRAGSGDRRRSRSSPAARQAARAGLRRYNRTDKRPLPGSILSGPGGSRSPR